jgi:hypothetical protein
MNRAVRQTASWLGISAGLAAVEHGYFELLQGSARPEGLFIASIGPPCQPELTWNSCEPALTIIPHFGLTGVLAIFLGLVATVWSIFFVQRRHGGLVLIALSFALLLFGGGIFPPLIGTIAGITGTRIHKPLTWWRAHSGGGFSRLLAKLYPWSLIGYLVMVLGQWVVGYFFNEFLMTVMIGNVLLFMSLLVIAVIGSFARDARMPQRTAVQLQRKV